MPQGRDIRNAIAAMTASSAGLRASFLAGVLLASAGGAGAQTPATGSTCTLSDRVYMCCYQAAQQSRSQKAALTPAQLMSKAEETCRLSIRNGDAAARTACTAGMKEPMQPDIVDRCLRPARK